MTKTIRCCLTPWASPPGAPTPVPTSPRWGPLVMTEMGIGVPILSLMSIGGQGYRALYATRHRP